MLKRLKQVTLSGLKACGIFKLVENSKWRRERLMILAYHGLSIDDEHIWDPELFMHPEVFRSRMERIKRSGYTVLPLDQAVERLYANDLPEKCLALTFDDGFYDFFKVANPILKEFGFPATLYLTTYYVNYNRPVFDEVIPYLLWKRRETTLSLRNITGQDLKFELSRKDSRIAAGEAILEYARGNKLSAEEKDALAATLAKELGIDYEAVCSNRLLHLLTPDEVRQLAADGVDIQLHTHRHRSPRERQLFQREIVDNRTCIEQMTGAATTHFCYPSGIHDRLFFPWLKEMGVVTATTCDTGLASQTSYPLLLPRFVDTSLQSSIEFEGWLTGVSDALPRRNKYRPKSPTD